MTDCSQCLAAFEKTVSAALFLSPDEATTKKNRALGLVRRLSLATFASDWQASDILARALLATKAAGCWP